MEHMATKPTADLSNEHHGIRQMTLILDGASKKLLAGAKVDKRYLTKIVEFLTNFADKCHHAKEENILFPRIPKTKANIKIINELLGEHKSGRDYVRGMKESLATYKRGNPDAVHIAVNMRGYRELILGHMKKEKDILFPIADKKIGKKDSGVILEKFERLEKDVIGEGKHEEYHSWLKELKKVFV